MKNINSLQKELTLVKKLIKDEIIEEKTISDLYKYIFKSDGKRLRAKLSLITSSINKRKNKKRLKLAAIIELLHTATLIHDDVVDESHTRRGVKSDKVSILRFRRRKHSMTKTGHRARHSQVEIKDIKLESK